MYNNILIISDNKYLCEEFSKIIKEQSLDHKLFTFAISPFSKFSDFKSLTPIIYDLKKDADIEQIITNHDLVFSIHCKQFFPEKLIDNIKCINIHPGYNPINRGWYPQVFAIINDSIIGATIHEIDNQLDHGAIISRVEVEKYSYDTSLSLYNRILDKEIELLKDNLGQILSGQYLTTIPEEEGNLYLKKDFNNLLEIDMEKEYKGHQLITKLRALSHGDFNNAFFIDHKTGKKIYINVTLNEALDEKN